MTDLTIDEKYVILFLENDDDDIECDFKYEFNFINDKYISDYYNLISIDNEYYNFSFENNYKVNYELKLTKPIESNTIRGGLIGFYYKIINMKDFSDNYFPYNIGIVMSVSLYDQLFNYNKFDKIQTELHYIGMSLNNEVELKHFKEILENQLEEISRIKNF
jgi:hypothetical protein